LEERPDQMSSHLSLLLLILIGDLAIIVLMKLEQADSLMDYFLVLVLAISGALVFYILARVAIAIYERFRDMG